MSGARVRQQQPHDAHEHDAGEAHVHGDGHLFALDLVQQLAVEPAEQDGEGRGQHQGAEEARGAVQPQLHRQGGAQQAGDDAQRQAEVEPAAGLDHGHQGQHEQGVLAEPVEHVRQGGVHPDPHRGRGEEQGHQEQEDDDPGPAEVGTERFETTH